MRASCRFLIGLLVSLPGLAVSAMPAGQGVDSATQARVVSDYGRLPMSFEANQGQVDAEVRYLARGPGYSLYLTPAEVVLSLRAGAPSDAGAVSTSVVRMRLAGAAPRPVLSGVDRLPGTSNYFIGNDPARWQSAIPNYAKVKYADIYPGIDLVYYGTQQQLEYDFIVAPGADPKRIVLDFDGTTTIALDANGNLVLATNAGAVVQHKPVFYQEIDGLRRAIEGRYRLISERQVQLEIASYDTAHPLVIDPILIYSTYLGGPEFDEALSIAVDHAGGAYLAGYTFGSFPTTVGGRVGVGDYDAFVVKLNPTGTALVYSTCLGGDRWAIARALAIDANRNVYVTGNTASSNFPTTAGAYQTVRGGDVDAFVTKLDATGTVLVYSTLLGGTGAGSSGSPGGVFSDGYTIAVDDDNHAYVAGFTTGKFPTTVGTFQTAFGGGGSDAFLLKLNSAGSGLVYSTYLGGTTSDGAASLALDKDGNVYVTGSTEGDFPTTPGAFQETYGGGAADAFAARVNDSGTGLLFSTYLGGESGDGGKALAVDGTGNIYITGLTAGGFPITPGAFQMTFGGSSDVFAAKLDRTGTSLVYSTYLGGPGWESGGSLVVDESGSAYIAGAAQRGFPITPGAYQTDGGFDDVFLSKLSANGAVLIYSTYMGKFGLANGIALDHKGNVYLTGKATGSFPTTPDAYMPVSSGITDAFVAKFAFFDSAVEYHHSAFDHYFVTSLPNEIAALDTGTFSGWSRTGRSFLTYLLDTPGTANVCRFWSAQTFAPKSSHFYTPYADECAKVKQDPVWQFEGHAFALRLPEVGLGYVTCPSDTRPLYRAYNRGMSGAPNHRYTTDPAVLGEMVAQGWQVEGDLWTRIFACVPAQE